MEMSNLPPNNSDSESLKIRPPSNSEIEADDFDASNYNDKTKVECICPKCGQKHKMNFHWIGRGTPRKYCAACKGSC
jgi:hypothetical protein